MQLRIKHIRTALLAVLLTTAFGLRAWGFDSAQADTVRRNLFREVRGCVVDSLTGKPIVSALVSASSGRKFAGHAATDNNGQFRLRWIARDSLHIEITHIGYLIRSLHPAGSGKELDIGTVRLSEDVKKIDEVVVNARMSIFTMRGDTVVFNPRAVKFMADDNAIDLLRRVPGIEINNGTITLMGETIAATYVNGKRIYGSGNNKGMDFVKGREVTSIEFYDEVDAQTYEDTGEIVRHKVADIKTSVVFRQNIIFNVSAAAGSDLDPDAEGRHAPRYSAHIDAHSYTEALQMFAEAGTGNISSSFAPGLGLGGDNKERTASARGHLTWNSGKRMVSMNLEDGRKIEREVWVSNFNASYDFNDNRSESASAQRYVYNPSPDYTSKIYGDTTSSVNRHGTHKISLNYNRNAKNSLLRRARLSASTGSQLRDQLRSAMLSTDGDISARTRSSDYSKGRNYNIDGSATLHRRLGRKFSTEGTLDFRYTTDRNNGMRVDTSLTSSRRYELVIPLSQRTFSANYSMFINYRLPKGWFARLFPSVSYTDGKHRAIATDLLTSSIDSASTSRYVDGRLTHRLRAEISKRKSNYNLSITGGYNFTQERRTEHFPDEEYRLESFFTPNASISFSLRSKSSWNNRIMYDVTSLHPSSVQLRDRLDTENPLWLTGGNPDLKSPVNNNLSINSIYGNFSKGIMLNLGLGGSLTVNDIASHSTSFASDTYLPQYDYTALKGSTLHSYVNLNGNYSLSVNAGIVLPLKNGRLRLNAHGSHSVRPTIYGSERIDTKSTGGSLLANVNKLFFSKLDLSVGSMTSLNHENNGRMSYNNLNQTLTSQIRFTPVERVSVGADYNLLFNRTTQASIPIVRSNVLNANIGIKFLRNRNLSVNATVLDILGRRSSLITRLEDTYVAESWSRTYSRYFLVSMRYEFNRKR